jgi:hypothetical protein
MIERIIGVPAAKYFVVKEENWCTTEDFSLNNIYIEYIVAKKLVRAGNRNKYFAGFP